MEIQRHGRWLSLWPLLMLAACASVPQGPRVTVMPAPGKPFEVFVDEDRLCRQWASQSLGSDPAAAVDRAWINSAAVGTAVGAVAGAAMGGRDGAGTGAAMGAVVGSTAGAGQSTATSYDLQRRYDVAYQQCMYAKGNQIPGYRTQATPGYGGASPPAPGMAYPPPPPTR